MISLADRQHAVLLIEETVRSGARRASACRELDVSVRTVERWRQGSADTVRHDGRPEAVRPPTREPSHRGRACRGPGGRQQRGLREPAAESDRAEARRSTTSSRARTVRRPTSHCGSGPNAVWCWDVTWLPAAVKGTYYYWYMILDIYSRKIVGHEVHETESADLASSLVRRASLAEGLDGRPLVLHSDNGGAMKGSTMLATLEHLGIAPSFSRPRVGNDNPYAEALFRTGKYRPEYPAKPFTSLTEARTWVLRFVRWYNEDHQHSGIRFVTPQQRHSGEALPIIERRKRLYRAARQRHPERWSRDIRHWDLPTEVWLNPERASKETLSETA